jgi:DNA-binding transcriptional MerR regulator/uncharacterized protein (DUF433 family)
VQHSASWRLTGAQLEDLWSAFKKPRGRYSYERAAQLSGVPTRTIHHWAREGLLVPDFDHERPKRWSYRDLVFLRLFTWLRTKGMPAADTSARINSTRHALEASRKPIAVVRSQGRELLLESEGFDRLSGEQLFPEVVQCIADFDLLAPIPEVGRHRLWGPNLVRPSHFTSISPSVMAGEPCLKGSRVPTSSLFVLHSDRDLPPAHIAKLYPGVKLAAILDAIDLEGRLRHVLLAA